MIKEGHETVCLVLSREQHDWLRYRACAERRTMSSIVRDLVEAAMAKDRAAAEGKEATP